MSKWLPPQMLSNRLSQRLLVSVGLSITTVGLATLARLDVIKEQAVSQSKKTGAGPEHPEIQVIRD